ncbi:Lysine--tRNA ligase [Lachnellula subtilissima]|uniref:lysine--tRNA ligase n=1 Tax=Lachnellula subtilissima TaxID=602034 RepID=A0A8H8RXB9_9HELO|nr:Lysine--tRNA ligase [Lachnellula subtilissima]
MTISPGLRFLRPYLCKDLAVSPKHAYLRFFSSTRCLGKKAFQKIDSYGHDVSKGGGEALKRNTNDRITKLESANALKWPRVQNDVNALTLTEYNEKYKRLQAGAKLSDETVLIRGRLMSFRIAGGKLIFLDIYQDGYMVQGICNQGDLDAFSGITKRAFKEFWHKLQRGDFISMYGHPHVTQQSKGELSMYCIELPQVLAPSISLIPRKLEDREARIRNRHVDMLVNPKTSDTIRIRSHIIQYVRNFLLDDQFLEVQTPIISDSAGGAIARPFTTVATEFSDKQLALRVAPEIWLKRLVIGGMDRVFEIGPAFRNEGLDATHNPEFTTCEFYKSFADLNDLMSMTEKMVSGIASLVSIQRKHPLTSLPEPDASLSAIPYKRIQFIPAIEKALEEKLPDLADDQATEKLLALCKKHSIKLTEGLTLPRILDKLASIFIEPDCEAPTYIIYPPACMAPLAKSFIDPATKQIVSARAELFIQKREMANMYEEENSPFEQRVKFMQQAKFKDDENKAFIDESYLEALEWGLPPTGGWGCGIDRMVMLFSGAKRISDVLAFGSLKNVVNLGNPAPRASGVVQKLQDLASGPKDVSESKSAKKKKKKKAAASEAATSVKTTVASEGVTPVQEAASSEATTLVKKKKKKAASEATTPVKKKNNKAASEAAKPVKKDEVATSVKSVPQTESSASTKESASEAESADKADETPAPAKTSSAM